MIHELINCFNGISENGFSNEDNQILLHDNCALPCCNVFILVM